MKFTQKRNTNHSSPQSARKTNKIPREEVRRPVASSFHGIHHHTICLNFAPCSATATPPRPQEQQQHEPRKEDEPELSQPPDTHSQTDYCQAQRSSFRFSILKLKWKLKPPPPTIPIETNFHFFASTTSLLFVCATTTVYALDLIYTDLRCPVSLCTAKMLNVTMNQLVVAFDYLISVVNTDPNSRAY